MPKVFIAGYDGSDGGRRAVAYALDQAQAGGAKLVVAHVLEWSPYSFLTAEELAERHKRRNEELTRAQTALLDPLLTEIGDKGVPVETEVRFGHVAETICTIAHDREAKQIFIGRTGHSTLVLRLFGSVAGSLAQIAPVPCTIVP